MIPTHPRLLLLCPLSRGILSPPLLRNVQEFYKSAKPDILPTNIGFSDLLPPADGPVPLSLVPAGYPDVPSKAHEDQQQDQHYH